MIQIIGYIGSLAYALCGVPQACLSLRNGHSRGVARGFGWLSLIGSLFSLAYTIPHEDVVLTLNFGCNVIVWSVILKYSYFERH